MEPNDIQNDAPKQPVVEVAEEKVVGIEEKPVAEKPVAPEKKKKTNVAAILAVIFGILALAGIGFGVFSVMKLSEKEEEISNLRFQIENNETCGKEEVVNNGDDDDTIVDAGDVAYKNPIITSSVEGYELFQDYEFPFPSRPLSDNVHDVINIELLNGEINSCRLGKKQNNVPQYWEADNCSIVGLSGKIYKAFLIGGAQDASSSSFGFIMQDGTVQYVEINIEDEDFDSNKFSIDGVFETDGFVIDAVPVLMQELSTRQWGFRGPLLVLKDGRTVSMGLN